jgi:hypothetical protein
MLRLILALAVASFAFTLDFDGSSLLGVKHLSVELILDLPF